jgi:hypothetical protein
VLNLRHYHGDTEKQQVESAGLRYERIALGSSDAPRAEQVARFLEIVRDPSLRPLYVHCKHGVDRTGAMMSVYRMEEEGWSNLEAFAEMEFFEANKIFQDLRNYVRAYRPEEAAETMSASGPPGFGAPGAINPYSPPAASIEASSPAAASGYRSALPLAKAMVVILGMEVVLELISDLNAFLTIGVMQRVMAGQQVAETQLSAIDTRTSAVAVLGMVLTVIVIVQFCLFMPRANRNARSFGSQLRITPRWAAGFLFVPIANLWKPYQAMKEIWQGSDPDPNVHAWSVEAPAVMKWWWGAYLLSNIGTYLTVRTAKISPSAEEMISSCWAEIISSVFGIASAILAALTVRAVARRQAARQQAHPAGSPPLTAGVAL